MEHTDRLYWQDISCDAERNQQVVRVWHGTKKNTCVVL